MEKEIICVSCPVGCRLTVNYNDDKSDIKITGNACPRGLTYGKDEITAPKRMITTTVRLGNGAMLPVKTAQPAPKEKIEAILEAIKQIKADAPQKMGNILLQNAAETGVDIVASKSID